MFKAVEEREYLDYDYLSDEEIIYQGYDTDRDPLPGQGGREG